MDQLEDESNILTRFVIVEKYINHKYHTPVFDLQGNKISIYSSTLSNWYSSFSNRIFVSPGIYAKEFDIVTPEFELITYDLVASPGFDCKIHPKKILPLQNGQKKYRDTS